MILYARRRCFSRLRHDWGRAPLNAAKIRSSFTAIRAASRRHVYELDGGAVLEATAIALIW
jgi:hypothetical protein